MDDKMMIAVLIDGENVAPRYLPAIMGEIQRRGTCAIKRIYGDWTSPHMNGWKPLLQRHAIRPFQQFRYGENATDDAIIMDAMEILYTRSAIDCFCIVSSDSDFYNMCSRIRESGRIVIGIGEKKTRDVLQRACNTFVFLENLETAEPDDTGQVREDESDPETILKRAYADRLADDEWVPFASLGSAARSVSPSFDPRTYNHPTFRSLVESLDCFEVRCDDRIPPNYFCRLKEAEPAAAPRKKDGVVKDFGSWYGFIEGDDGDYYFTRSNVRKDQQHLRVRRGVKTRFDVLKAPNPSAVESYERNGKAENVELVDP